MVYAHGVLHEDVAVMDKIIVPDAAIREYNKKYGVDNPHVPLFKELKAAGVKIFVCSQSMIGRQLTPDMITEEVVPATSMLTTLTTYQLKGYAALKF